MGAFFWGTNPSGKLAIHMIWYRWTMMNGNIIIYCYSPSLPVKKLPKVFRIHIHSHPEACLRYVLHWPAGDRLFERTFHWSLGVEEGREGDWYPGSLGHRVVPKTYSKYLQKNSETQRTNISQRGSRSIRNKKRLNFQSRVDQNTKSDKI